MRFDDALRSLHEALRNLLTGDPQWMRKAAEIHARRGETEAAVKALRTALIGGPSGTATTVLRSGADSGFLETCCEPARGSRSAAWSWPGADLPHRQRTTSRAHQVYCES